MTEEGYFACLFHGIRALFDQSTSTLLDKDVSEESNSRSYCCQANTKSLSNSHQSNTNPQPILILNKSTQLFYGQHISRGFPALEYAKSPIGVFKPVTKVSYNCNYYKKWETPTHPFNFGQVLESASHPPDIHTCRDADGILFADFDEDGEVDSDGPEYALAYAFVEHFGVNENHHIGTPFMQSWFDDNYVARIAMRAYCSMEPWGLYVSRVKSRFVVMEGDKTHDPYPGALEDPAQYPDQISLHAFYLANNGKWGKVEQAFWALVKKAGAKYNIVTKRFDYLVIRDFYHLCDMKMVFQRLLDSGTLKGKEESLVFQHVVSLHSQIMSLQIKSKETGEFSSWKTGVKVGDGSLINTETTVLAMLALGAGSLWTFEFVESPMIPLPGLVQFPDTLPHALCARLYENKNIGNGLIIAKGPFVRIPTGKYSALINVRVVKGRKKTKEKILTVQVFDGIEVVASQEFGMESLADAQFEEGWKRICVPFDVVLILISGPIEMASESKGVFAALHAWFDPKHRRRHDALMFAMGLCLFFGGVLLVLLGTATSKTKAVPVLLLSNQSFYGQHVSRGFAALAFLSDKDLGTLRPVYNINYTFNYYPQWATEEHPYSFGDVLQEGVLPSIISTARDGQGILWGDFDNNLELDRDYAPQGSYAFVEHVGVNEYLHQGQPFYHAWFDDNYVASIAMRVYGSPEPWGLHDSPVKSRFVVMEGDDTYDPYPSALTDNKYVDQISIHALYLANNNDWANVDWAFYSLLRISDAVYNATTKRYDYPSISDFYHLCDMKIVFQRLLDSDYLKKNIDEYALVLQHVISLHGIILQLHIRNSLGVFVSWKTGVVPNDGTLINTETTVLAMLALGAGSAWVFEFFEYPMISGAGFAEVLPGVLGARLAQYSYVGNGLVASGPFVQIPAGNYTAHFNVRVVK
ncbi:UNVERIFIED_CONTAM: hypothetical protein HDU68_004262, partial [Siphonaria sp. JEL0065]